MYKQREFEITIHIDIYCILSFRTNVRNLLSRNIFRFLVVSPCQNRRSPPTGAKGNDKLQSIRVYIELTLNNNNEQSPMSWPWGLLVILRSIFILIIISLLSTLLYYIYCLIINITTIDSQFHLTRFAG